MLKVAFSRAIRRGFGKRQPIEVSNAAPGLPHALSGLACTQGARVIDSTPPATMRSASPARIAWAAIVIAVMPEAQSRLTVTPGTESGSPASSTAMRATFRLSSPAWFAAPRMTSSMSAAASWMPCAPHGLGDDECGQVVGTHARERAAVASDGGAGAAHEKGLGHPVTPDDASVA